MRRNCTGRILFYTALTAASLGVFWGTYSCADRELNYNEFTGERIIRNDNGLYSKVAGGAGFVTGIGIFTIGMVARINYVHKRRLDEEEREGRRPSGEDERGGRGG
ncbi:MAG: hypothetical protein ABIH92_04580 [Nanoarchaeota archaeon]